MNESSFTPQIVYKNPTELRPYAQNAKKHPPEQVEKIAAQIAAAGFDVPIVVDRDLVVIKGHGRREAAIQLGLERVPVIIRDDLSEMEVKAARIADNRVSESGWDYDVLAFEFGTLDRNEFDLRLTGFEEAEWNAFLKDESFDFSLTEAAPDSSDADAEDEELSDEEAPSETRHVKMIQLYLTEETAPEFQSWCEDLEKVLGTDNLTDTVFEAVRAYHRDKVSPTA